MKTLVLMTVALSSVTSFGASANAHCYAVQEDPTDSTIGHGPIPDRVCLVKTTDGLQAEIYSNEELIFTFESLEVTHHASQEIPDPQDQPGKRDSRPRRQIHTAASNEYQGSADHFRFSLTLTIESGTNEGDGALSFDRKNYIIPTARPLK